VLGTINAKLQTMVESVSGERAVIALVIGLNLAIALGGFVVAWRLWQLKRTLTAATVTLTTLEQATRLALSPDQTPTQLLQGRDAIALTRTRYRRLQRQLRQLQQIFATTVMISRLVRGGRGIPHRPSRNR